MDTTASRGQLPDTPMIDALEAVRRLTLERDALAEQVKRLEERQTIIMQKRDDTIQDLAFARADIKRLTNGLERAHATINALQAPERRAKPETDTETGEGGNGAPQVTTGEKTPILCACCRKPITKWLFCDDCEARARRNWEGK